MSAFNNINLYLAGNKPNLVTLEITCGNFWQVNSVIELEVFKDRMSRDTWNKSITTTLTFAYI